MRYTVLILLSMITFAGCFDSSPPKGVAGEVVGCITAGEDLYCTTKYAKRGAKNSTPVLIGEIDFEVTRSHAVEKFNLGITYTNKENEEVSRSIFEGIFTRVFPGDTVAVAIVNPPTLQLPHQGYIIANFTRPEVKFEIPEEIGNVNIIELIP